MENTVNESVAEIDKQPGSRFKNWGFITVCIVIIIALVFTAIGYYQATRFNANTRINGINVGGMSAEQALEKLKNTVLKNEVYVGKQQIFDGKDTKMGFTAQDLPKIKKILKSQWTFFPPLKEKNYLMIPAGQDPNQSQAMEKQVKEKLLSLNKGLTAPKDAQAILKQGKISISKSSSGQQYDIDRLLKDYKGQKYNSVIRLSPKYIQPIREDSPVVKKEVKKLQELLQQSVDYKVQNTTYNLKADDLIKNAAVSKHLKVTIDPGDIKKKIKEINASQSTLNKNFKFRTHSGSVISVKGQGYGWALDVDKEAKQIQTAFEKGKELLPAKNIIGNGWSGEGFGYETTANNGIGNTYAEVSIKEQRVWLYKNGKLVLTTHAVTGKHITGEDTSPGIWYILYKRSPYTLRGSAVGKASYAVKVSYWAPFTNSGQGFHDASWRTNWSSNAYLTAGSGGCVNLPPSIAKQVYDNLTEFEPVVIY